MLLRRDHRIGHFLPGWSSPWETRHRDITSDVQGHIIANLGNELGYLLDLLMVDHLRDQDGADLEFDAPIMHAEDVAEHLSVLRSGQLLVLALAESPEAHPHLIDPFRGHQRGIGMGDAHPRPPGPLGVLHYLIKVRDGRRLPTDDVQRLKTI